MPRFAIHRLVAPVLALSLGWSPAAWAAGSDRRADQPSPPPLAPLVLAAPVALPSAGDVAIDLALTTGLAYLGWRFAPSLGGDPALMDPAQTGTSLVTSAAILGAVGLPPAALTAWRSQPFGFDRFFAAAAGSLAGLGVGFGLSRLLGAGAPDQGLLALCLAGGQGIGTVAAFHVYGAYRESIPDRDKLPTQRADDPLDNWQYWRGKRPK